MSKYESSSVVKTTEAEWHEAQKYEANTWAINNKDKRNTPLKVIVKFVRSLRHPKRFFQMLKFRDFYCGDDWNYWWMEKFENYKALPDKMDKALEVGSGPYSNIRVIARLKRIGEIVCTDPLMDKYKKFKLTWVSTMAKRGRIVAQKGMCENIEYSDGHFDLVVCNNVLDHVLDAEKGLSEMYRVLRPGGYFVFAQDLTDAEGIAMEEHREGHPIRLDHVYLDGFFEDTYEPVFKRVLSREESRDPAYYGTYIMIGKKK